MSRLIISCSFHSTVQPHSLNQLWMIGRELDDQKSDLFGIQSIRKTSRDEIF